jgi:outer membrane protein TolC
MKSSNSQSAIRNPQSAIAVLLALVLSPALLRAEIVPEDFPQVQRSGDELAVKIPQPAELPIDLPTVLRLAGVSVLDVKFAQEQLREARGRRLEADMSFLPTIRPLTQLHWDYGQVQDTGGTFQIAHDDQSALEAINATLDLHLGESIYASLAARRRVTASEAGVRTSIETASLQSSSAFFNLVLARAEKAIVEERIKEGEETVRVTQEFLNSGTGLLAEVRRAEASLAGVEQRLETAKENLRTTSLALTTVLHIDPLVVLDPQQQPEELIRMVPAAAKLPELVEESIRLRPELAQSRALFAALGKERAASVWGPAVPRLLAEATTGIFGPHPDQYQGTHEYLARLEWVIGQGGIGDVARIRISEARLREEGVRFDKIADQVMADVVNAFARVEAAGAQIELSKKEITAATETLRLENERLKNGTAITLEVITAEDALFAARERMAQYITEFNKAQYALFCAIGGFQDLEARR